MRFHKHTSSTPFPPAHAHSCERCVSDKLIGKGRAAGGECERERAGRRARGHRVLSPMCIARLLSCALLPPLCVACCSLKNHIVAPQRMPGTRPKESTSAVHREIKHKEASFQYSVSWGNACLLLISPRADGAEFEFPRKQLTVVAVRGTGPLTKPRHQSISNFLKRQPPNPKLTHFGMVRQSSGASPTISKTSA
eukprot:1072579-Rhodomonas_salina.1